MQEDIEVFADTLLVVLVTFVALLLSHVDPKLPFLWMGATMFMTWLHVH